MPEQGLCINHQFRNVVVLSASEGPSHSPYFINVEEKSGSFSSRRKRRSFRTTMADGFGWITQRFPIKLIKLPLLAVIAIFAATSSPIFADGGKTAFQTGALAALMEGVFEGDTTFADLKKRGDMGIGTFNGLDGEMAAVDGVFYRIKFDGTATPATDSDKTPFSTVARFSPDKEIMLGPVDGFNALTAQLDKELPTENIVYAVRIDGVFAHIKARSVPGYHQPYPKLTEIVKTQSHLPYENEEGTLVGFRFPEYAKGVNVPGWHLHFLTKDRKRGGHVLDVKFEKTSAGLVFLNGFSVELQKGGELYGVKLGAGAETKGVFTDK